MNRIELRYPALAALLKGIVETLFYTPLLLIAAVYSLPSEWVAVWLLTLPLIYMAGSVMIVKLKKDRRIYRLLLALAGGVIHTGLTAILMNLNNEAISYYAPGLVMLGAIITYRGIQQSAKGWLLSFPNQVMFYGLIASIIVQILKKPLTNLASYGLLLTICGIAAVITTLYLVNERLLSNETDASGKVTQSTASAFKRQNRVMISIAVVILLIISLFRQLQQGVEALVTSIVAKIMEWLNRPEEEIPVEPEQGQEIIPPESILTDVVKEPAAWMLWIEQAMKVIGIIIVIILVLVGLYFACRGLWKLGRKLYLQLLERSTEKRSQEAGYTDEVESLMTLNKWSDELRNSMNKLFSGRRGKEGQWGEQMTGAERVRYLYSRLLKTQAVKGYAIQAHLTPKETANDLMNWRNQSNPSADEQELVQLYEEVRYGNQQPDSDKIAALKKRLDEVRNHDN